MRGNKKNRNKRESGFSGETLFMTFAFVVAFIFGAAKAGPELYEMIENNGVTTVFFSKEDYMLSAKPEHDLSNYDITDWYYRRELRYGAYVKVKGYVNRVPISLKQKIRRNDCRIHEVKVKDTGIEYGVSTGDVNAGKINAKDVEQCLVRFFEMLSEVSKKQAVEIVEKKRRMIEKEINRSSFVNNQ